MLSFSIYSYRLRFFLFVQNLSGSILFYKEIHKATLSFSFFDQYQFLKHTLPFVCLNLSILFILRFWTTLIFGVSFSQFILGLRGSVSGWWDRIGGSIRVLFEFLFLPLFLFELVCLFRLRTLKEFLTYTHVVDREPKIPIFRIILLTPLFLLLMFMAPLYNNPSLSLNKEIKVISKIKELKAKKKELRSTQKTLFIKYL